MNSCLIIADATGTALGTLTRGSVHGTTSTTKGGARAEREKKEIEMGERDGKEKGRHGRE